MHPTSKNQLATTILGIFTAMGSNTDVTSYSLSEIANNCGVITYADLAKVESIDAWIPRGNGNSYSPSAQITDGLAIKLTEDCISWLNESKTLLVVDGGADIKSVYDFCLKSDRSLKVVPGTGSVTIGGAIAFDVHGKNHNSQGTFCQHVRELNVRLASGETIKCSRGEQVDLFRATIGGMGLTGIILNAVIEVENKGISHFLVSNSFFENYDRLLDTLAEASTDSHQIAWLNLTRSDKFQAILTRARPDESLSHEVLKRREIRYKIPLNFFSKINILIITNLRMLSQRINCGKHKRRNYGAVLFPLDTIPEWKYMFGKKGLVEFQFCFPRSSSNLALELIKQINKQSPGVLIALKYFGDNKSIGLMSFPSPGYCFGITTHSALLKKEDLQKYASMVTQLKGRCYLAKNCSLNFEELKAQYSQHDEFLQIKNRFDPRQNLASDLSRSIFFMDMGHKSLSD